MTNTPPIKVSVPEKALLDAIAQTLRDFKAKMGHTLAVELAPINENVGRAIGRTEGLTERITRFESLFQRLEHHFFEFRAEADKQIAAAEETVQRDRESVESRIGELVAAVKAATTSVAEEVNGYDVPGLREAVEAVREGLEGLEIAHLTEAEGRESWQRESEARYETFSAAHKDLERRFEAYTDEFNSARDALDYQERTQQGLNSDFLSLAQKVSQAWNLLNPLKERVKGLEAFRDTVKDIRSQVREVSEIAKTHIDELGSAIREIEAHGDVQDQRLDDMDHRAQEIEERASGTIATVTSLIESSIPEIADRIGRLEEEMVRDYAKLSSEMTTLGLRIEEMPEIIEEAISPVAGHVQEVQEDLIGLGADVRTDRVARELWERAYLTTNDWAPSDTGFGQDAAVRHRNGIWRAVRPTFGEPGESEDWIQLTGSVAAAWVVQMDLDRARIKFEETGGRSFSTPEFKLPMPTPCGIYDRGKSYLRADQVSHRGTLYQALVHNPESEPGTNEEEWALLVKRGPRGAKGPQGDPGVVPPISKFFETWMEWLDEGAGMPILGYGGAWRYGQPLRRGFLYYHMQALYIALQDVARAEVPPSAPLPDRQDLAVMYPKPAGGGAGNVPNLCEIRGQTGFYPVPAFVSGTVDADRPTRITMAFDGPIELASECALPYGLTVKYEGVSKAILSVAVVPTSSDLELIMEEAPSSGDAVTWSYAAGDPVCLLRADDGCNPATSLDDVTDQPITNPL